MAEQQKLITEALQTSEGEKSLKRLAELRATGTVGPQSVEVPAMMSSGVPFAYRRFDTSRPGEELKYLAQSYGTLAGALTAPGEAAVWAQKNWPYLVLPGLGLAGLGGYGLYRWLSQPPHVKKKHTAKEGR